MKTGLRFGRSGVVTCDNAGWSGCLTIAIYPNLRLCLRVFSRSGNREMVWVWNHLKINFDQSNVSLSRMKNDKFPGPWAKSTCFSDNEKGKSF